MLSALNERIKNRMLPAVASAITVAEFLDYDGNSHPTKEIFIRYHAATLTFHLSELDSLSTEEQRKLRGHFETLYLETLSNLGLPISAGLLSWVHPDSPRNVIKHELDHCGPLPPKAREKTIVEITFMKIGEITYPNGGFQILEDVGLDERTKALCLCNPDTLSDADAEMAVYYAGQTSDPDLMAEVLRTISIKPKHDGDLERD